jgi:hypothetical protein
MSYKHTSKDGLAYSSDKRLTKLWDDIGKSQKVAEKQWIEQLRSIGVKAAHPNDGWVDRENNEVQLVYPQFNDGLAKGDSLALGWPDEYRLVRVINTRQAGILMPHIIYIFEESNEWQESNQPKCCKYGALTRKLHASSRFMRYQTI